VNRDRSANASGIATRTNALYRTPGDRSARPRATRTGGCAGRRRSARSTRG
jgi:hypothetical protein